MIKIVTKLDSGVCGQRRIESEDVQSDFRDFLNTIFGVRDNEEIVEVCFPRDGEGFIRAKFQAKERN